MADKTAIYLPVKYYLIILFRRIFYETPVIFLISQITAHTVQRLSVIIHS